MWVEKNSEDHRQDQRKRLLRVRIIAVALWLFFSFVYPFVPSRMTRRQQPFPNLSVTALTSSHFLVVALLYIVGTGIAVYVVYYRPRVRPGRKEPPETVVCPRCEIVKVPDGQLKCQCGGQYYDIRDMKWVETEKQS